MELDSFKAILLRKADGNTNLLSLLNEVEEDFLVETVVDALEKMAIPTANTGLKANGPLQGFGQHLTSTDINQLRSALGHHLSHYKAALKAHHAAPEGSPEKAKMRQVADQHLEHLFPLMHLAARVGKHSGGKLQIDYPPIAPWETNYTTLARSETTPGKAHRVPKLLYARTKKSGTISANTKDYHFLEMPPHPGHKMVSKMPHSGGYPWEEVQVGSPANIDAKKAYLPVKDIPNKTEYTPHAFDQHPIRGVQDIQEDYVSDDTRDAYTEAAKQWPDSEHHKKWLEDERAEYQANPEGYKARGQSKGSHFYEGIPLLPQEDHVHQYPAQPKFQAPTPGASPKTASSASASAAASKPAINVQALPPELRHLAQKVGPTVRRPQAQAATASTAQPSSSPAAPTANAPAAAPHPYEDMYAKFLKMPKDVQRELLDIPAFAKYVASKGWKRD
jgi:hypothetical protein